MTIADYIFAACMTVVIVWIVSESDRRGPFQKVWARQISKKELTGEYIAPPRETETSRNQNKKEEEAGGDADAHSQTSGS